MNRPGRFEGPKRATNVSLSAELVEEARKLGINVSEACQTGLAAEVKKARETAWKEENRAAIERRPFQRIALANSSLLPVVTF